MTKAHHRVRVHVRVTLLQLPTVGQRVVQLGQIFINGVDHAHFINDACGAPVPSSMAQARNFYDGKLFHYKCLKANANPHLLDMCDGQVRRHCENISCCCDRYACRSCYCC